jgi:uncharacterized protein (TIGR03067 family)
MLTAWFDPCVEGDFAMKVRLLAVAAVGLLLTAGAPPEAAKKDLKKLQGTWQLSSEIQNGTEQAPEYIKSITLSFDKKGGWILFKEDRVLYKGSTKLDPTKKPKEIDFTLTTDDENKGREVRGIYELKGDSFRLCWSLENDRPTALESKEGSGNTYSQFVRAKSK